MHWYCFVLFVVACEVLDVCWLLVVGWYFVFVHVSVRYCPFLFLSCRFVFWCLSLFGVCCVLFVVCCEVYVVCLLSVVCSLCVARCLLFVVCCLSCVVGCWLLVVVCRLPLVMCCLLCRLFRFLLTVALGPLVVTFFFGGYLPRVLSLGGRRPCSLFVVGCVFLVVSCGAHFVLYVCFGVCCLLLRVVLFVYCCVACCVVFGDACWCVSLRLSLLLFVCLLLVVRCQLLCVVCLLACFYGCRLLVIGWCWFWWLFGEVGSCSLRVGC